MDQKLRAAVTDAGNTKVPDALAVEEDEERDAAPQTSPKVDAIVSRRMARLMESTRS